jgi:hypothetical protein
VYLTVVVALRSIAPASAALRLASISPDVDVALVLAVDASSSMTPEERKLQRDGYAEALTSPAVLQAIADGLHHRIAILMFEWGSIDAKHVIAPWTIIDGPESARAMGKKIRDAPTEDLARTAISAALDYAGTQLAQSGFRADRRVIDVSGDGPNNEGQVVSIARDNLVKRGIIINGLPIIRKTDPGGEPDWLGIPDLDEYYEHCVIGGEGAFMIPVIGMDNFATALQTKLVTEIANVEAPSRIIPAAGRDWSRGCKLYE